MQRSLGFWVTGFDSERSVKTSFSTPKQGQSQPRLTCQCPICFPVTRCNSAGRFLAFKEAFWLASVPKPNPGSGKYWDFKKICFPKQITGTKTKNKTKNKFFSQQLCCKRKSNNKLRALSASSFSSSLIASKVASTSSPLGSWEVRKANRWKGGCSSEAPATIKIIVTRFVFSFAYNLYLCMYQFSFIFWFIYVPI